MVSLLFYRLYVAISSIGKTSLIFLSILLIPSLSIYAQNKSFKIKVSDGNTYDMPSAGAKLEEDSTLTIIGGQSGEELNYFQLQLKPHKKGLYEKGFTIGKYYFNYKTKMLESSYDYDASAMYSKVRNGEIIFKYTTDIYSQGVITIESISPTNIKGKFTCVVNQNIPKTGNTLTIEGTFDVPFSTLKQNNNLQNNTNQESPTTSNNKKEYKAPIGLFDINASIGVNWTKPIKAMPKRDFGTDYDLGVTFLNIRHSKEMSSATVMELHVDYSRQNFNGTGLDWHFRRKEIYGRFRPFTNDASSSTEFSKIIAICLAGLYVDVGYTDAIFYASNLMNGRLAPDYYQSGMFWGWGCNMKWRTERIGAILGFGSKRYSYDGHQYKSKSITLGITYNIIWNDN